MYRCMYINIHMYIFGNCIADFLKFEIFKAFMSKIFIDG